MSDARIALLPDRGVVAVTGEDARKLLGGVITQDIDLLEAEPAIFAGLLSPQGKVLFDFIVVRTPAGYFLDVAAECAEGLAKRLILYRLRAKVDVAVDDRKSVLVAFGELGGARETGFEGAFFDPRDSRLGQRAIMPMPAYEADRFRAWGPSGEHEVSAHTGAYHAHRIFLGVPEGGKDYDFGDTFPHEANFDLIGGVSFEKGCYVGQEIVARMQHRGTVRKRVARVIGASDLPPTRPDLKMGDVVIGRLGSVAGKSGLALLRLDRAIEAIDKGEPITAAGIALDVDPEVISRQRKLMAEKAGQS